MRWREEGSELVQGAHMWYHLGCEIMHRDRATYAAISDDLCVQQAVQGPLFDAAGCHPSIPIMREGIFLILIWRKGTLTCCLRVGNFLLSSSAERCMFC